MQGKLGMRGRIDSPIEANCRYLHISTDVLYHLRMAASRISALRFVGKAGVFRPADFQAHGLSKAELYRLVREGAVIRTARGLYTAAQHQPTAGHSLAQVAKRVPAGVFCLLTALRFHELTTQSPPDVWLALPTKARKPH